MFLSPGYIVALSDRIVQFIFVLICFDFVFWDRETARGEFIPATYRSGGILRWVLINAKYKCYHYRQVSIIVDALDATIAASSL